MEEIRTKILSGDYGIVDNTSRTKSDIWEKFGLVQDQENNLVNGCAVPVCKTCHKALNYESRELGTASLETLGIIIFLHSNLRIKE